MVLSSGNKKKKYRVSFVHFDKNDFKITANTDSVPYEYGTFCKISEMNDTINAVGLSLVSKHDRFCRATGRKIALAKALKKTNFNKKVRTALWKSYFKICPIT